MSVEPPPKKPRCDGFVPSLELDGEWFQLDLVNGGDLQVLGAGSFGVVIKASCPKWEHPLALKVLACANEKMLEMVRQERRLEEIGPHNNIASLIKWIELPADDAGLCSLKKSLKKWIDRQPEDQPVPAGMLAPNLHAFCVAVMKYAGDQELFDYACGSS